MKRNLLLVVSVAVVVLMGGVLLIYIFMARPSIAQEAELVEKVIVAEQFRLVDKEGKTRAMLLVGEKGNVSLNFYDRNKKNRAALGLSPEGAAVLKFFDAGSLELIDREDRTRAKVAMLSDGSPSVRLYDSNNGVRAILGSINLETAETKRSGSFEKRAESSLVLSNKEGKVVWSAP